jgi:hypothetical protein
MRKQSMKSCVSVFALLVVLADCGKSSVTASDAAPSTPVSFTNYSGTFANLRTSGTIVVSVADTGSATGTTSATGAIVFLDGATASVTGTYIRGRGLLGLSGGGDEVTGALANGTIAGTFSEPTSSGKFAVQAPTAAGTSKLYCGTYVTSSDYGWFSFVASAAGNVGGFAVALVSGNSVSFTGTIANLSLSATTSENVQLQGTLSPDGTTVAGTYAPSGALAGSGSFQGSIAACSAPGASTNSGVWTTSDTTIFPIRFHFALVQSLDTISGSGIITAAFVPNWTGDEFVLTSGSIIGNQISFTAQLGANPNGAGGFYYGTLTFTGTITGTVTGTGTGTISMAGTVTFTPPRTATQQFAPETITGVILTMN